MPRKHHRRGELGTAKDTTAEKTKIETETKIKTKTKTKTKKTEAALHGFLALDEPRIVAHLACEVQGELLLHPTVSSSSSSSPAGKGLHTDSSPSGEEPLQGRLGDLANLGSLDGGRHTGLLCRIVGAYVRQAYWHENKVFLPSRPDLPPYLTFAGSQIFGYVHAPLSSPIEKLEVDAKEDSQS
jgi:hypothetical protein